MNYIVDFIRRMNAQVQKMMVDKYDEGIRMHADPGEPFLLMWPFSGGISFSQRWKNCLCRTCVSFVTCGFKTASECRHYEFDESLVEGPDANTQLEREKAS